MKEEKQQNIVRKIERAFVGSCKTKNVQARYFVTYHLGTVKLYTA